MISNSLEAHFKAIIPIQYRVDRLFIAVDIYQLYTKQNIQKIVFPFILFDYELI